MIPKLTKQYVGISFGERQFLKFTTPSILIMGAVLVMVFKRIQIRNIRAVKVIKMLSPLTYGVFLIHEHKVFVDHVYRDRLAFLVGSHSTAYTVLVLILMGVSLFLACLGIDYLRSLLFRFLKADRLSEYLSVKISASYNAFAEKYR